MKFSRCLDDRDGCGMCVMALAKHRTLVCQVSRQLHRGCSSLCRGRPGRTLLFVTLPVCTENTTKIYLAATTTTTTNISTNIGWGISGLRMQAMIKQAGSFVQALGCDLGLSYTVYRYPDASSSNSFVLRPNPAILFLWSGKAG